MNWEDLLPANVARAQRRRERRDQMIRMRKAGFLNKQIGHRFGTSASNAQFQSREFVKIYTFWRGGFRHHNRLKEPTPVENYLRDDSDVVKLAKMILRKKK